MRAGAALAFLLAASACRADPLPYDDPAVTWVAAGFANATLRFPEPGRFAGKAPCNRYGGNQIAAWPDFRAVGLFATKLACPDLALEADFFAALSTATGAALDETGALVLIGPDGPLITFGRE